MNANPSPNFNPDKRHNDSSHRRRKSESERIFEWALKDWHGEERALLEAETKQSPPQAVGALLGPLLTSLDCNDRFLLRRINNQWRELVAPEIFHHATPRKIINKVLYLETTNASWRFHLERHYKNEIKELIRRSTEGQVQDVRFIAGGTTRY